MGVHALAARSPGLPVALYIHLQSTINTDIYLDLTFLTLAMLVVGGSAASGAQSSARS